MSFLIELAAKIIGAVAFFSTLFAPLAAPAPVATETTEKIFSSDKTSAQSIAAPEKPVAFPTKEKKAEKKSETKPAKPITEEKEKPEGIAPLYQSKAERTETSPALPTVASVPTLPPLSVPPLLPAPPRLYQPAAATTAPLQFSWESVNKKTRAALVNIICTTKRGGLFEPVSGSGVIIDPRGAIITNAHVAQYFLLKDYLVKDFIDCVIRTGEPAKNRYRAKLLYISPEWIRDNSRNIASEDHTGTGENDFALLLITKSVNEATLPLPEEYPFVPPDFSDESLRKKDTEAVLAAGYPAGTLGGINIQKEFYPVSSTAVIERVYSFGSDTPDVFSVHGSVLAQEGSSGGALVNASGKLIGIIATATNAPTTGERELHAITTSHMARSFRAQNSFSIETLLVEENLKELAEQFNRDIAPQLTKILTDELDR